MDVDALMDVTITACRDFFGRAVVYTPLDGSPTALRGEFRNELQGQAPTFDTSAASLEFRSLDLSDAGIVPTAEGDVVTFDFLGVSRTYKVTEVVRPDVGCVICRLGIRS